MRDLELIFDSIDKDLVEHIDHEGHLVLGTAERLLHYAKALAGAFVEAHEFDDMGRDGSDHHGRDRAPAGGTTATFTSDEAVDAGTVSVVTPRRTLRRLSPRLTSESTV